MDALCGEFNDNSDKVKVFAGTKLGKTGLYVLGERGGVEVVAFDALDPAVTQFFNKHLPSLTAEEKDMVSKFSIQPALFSDDAGNVKVFVGTKIGQTCLHVLPRMEVLTFEKIDPSVMEYLAKYLPPLTKEEEDMVSKFSIRPAASADSAPKP